MKIYTRQGDKGVSGLFDGRRVPKCHPRLEAYGTLDELNSHIGLAIAHCRHPSLQTQLLALQHQLLVLGSDLATPPGSANESKVTRIQPRDATELEHQIDAATAQLPPLKRFILPGGSLAAAALHIARTVCRRAERQMVSLMQQTPADPIGEQPLVFVNRLSDLLFVLARLANHLDGVDDIEWIPKNDRNKTP